MAISVLNTDAGLSGKTIVNAEDAQNVTGLKSFNRSPNAPFAVQASSAVVTNLDADKLDGQEGSFYTNASNLSSGTLPDARFPSVLPAVSGANLTGISQLVQEVQSAAVTADTTNTTNTYADVTGASITMTTGASARVLLLWFGPLRSGGTGVQAQLTFSVDGADGNVLGITQNTDKHSMAMARLVTGLSAASHTFKVRLRNDDNSSGVHVEGTQCNGLFVAIELTT